MSFSRTYVPRYFLKSGNHMSLGGKSTEPDCCDVLGFHQGLPVIQVRATTNNPTTTTTRRVMEEEGSSKLCGKRIILSARNLSRKVIIINAKNIQIPLTQCTPLKVNQEMLRRALKFPSANESLKDYTYQEGRDNAEALSRRCDKKDSSDLSTGIACSDFQEFEAKFYQEIAHKDPVLTRRIKSSGEDVEATPSLPEFDEPEFVHIPHKVYGRRERNVATSNCDGGIPEENSASNNNRSKSVRVNVMGKIKHFKDKNNQESQPKLIATSSSSSSTEVVSEASTSKTKPKKKTTLQMSSKRLLIRREIERCLMQQRRLKKPVKNRSVSTQTPNREMSTGSTQTDQDMFAIDEPFINHLLSEDQDDLFIRDNGQDTNFGQGPPPIKQVDIKNSVLLDISGKFAAMNNQYVDNFGVNPQMEQEKLNFFRCLNNCTEIKTMGNLNIHLAVCQNDVAEVQRQCLALRVRQRSVDAFNDNDMTPLHLAVINDCLPQIVHLLLKFGADITLTDQDGNNPLHLAVTAGAVGILEMLLSVTRQKNFKVDLYNFEGFTPLMLATLESNITITKMLLDSKASPNLRDQKSGRTPLFHAVESNNIELVRLLLRYKANTRISNFFGTSTHEAIFELDNINQEIKSMVIGKDLFQNRNKTGEKRRRAPARKEKPPSPVKKPKLKIVKMLKKVVT